MFYSKLLILLSCVEVVTAEVLTAPTNAAVEVGGSVTLSYKSSITTRAPSWIFYREIESETPTEEITQDCQVATNLATQYSTTRGAGGGECNLIILSATLDQGGLYFCATGFSDRKVALLTVVDVKLSINNTSEIVERDEVNVSCSVRRSTTQAPQQPLNLSWNVGPNISDSVNNSSLSSSGIVTAKRKIFPSYTCSISFGTLKNIPSNAYAANVPSPISKSTGATDVQYCPSVPEVSRSYNPDRLICRAEANPPPSYSWVDENGNTFLGAELKLNYSGTYTYTCIATTTIRGRVCYNTTDYNVTVSTTTSTKTSTTDFVTSPKTTRGLQLEPNLARESNSTSLIVGIVVGIGGAILLLIGIIVLLWYFKKRRPAVRDPRKKEDFDNIGIRGTDDDPHYQALNVLSTQPQETYEQLRPAAAVTRTGPGYENQVLYENVR